MKNSILFFFTIFTLNGQEIISEYLVIEGDTLDDFVYQIPALHGDQSSKPLLVALHQWGGNAMSSTYTDFDEEAYSRGWFFMSPFGGAPNNYNHQGAQDLWELEILWMLDQFDIDERRIYFVGGSMGGAAGMIYANNHLDPGKPMVAATASASGILDCERRYYEMDGNNSMIEWFGGTPEEVPFEYHRNSAVFFEDPQQSMHTNLQYTPLFMDFGATEPHRGHAEDLYDLLLDLNQNMWIETDPVNGHGYNVMEEAQVCDWLEQFELEDDPDEVVVKLDEPGRAYWVEATGQNNGLDFINIQINRIPEGLNNYPEFDIHQFNNADTLLLHILDTPLTDFYLRNLSDETIFVGIFGGYVDMIDHADAFYGYESNYFWSDPNTALWFWIGSGDEYRFSIFFDPTYDDVTLDGDWNIMDIVTAVYFILGWGELNIQQQDNADLNNDGNVNISDIILMVDLILEL